MTRQDHYLEELTALRLRVAAKLTPEEQCEVAEIARMRALAAEASDGRRERLDGARVAQ